MRKHDDDSIKAIATRLSRKAAEEYSKSLGQIVGGSWRLIAWAHEQKIPQLMGMSTEQWVKETLGGYIRLPAGERVEAVQNLTAEGRTQRETADILGVSPATVNSDVQKLTKPDRRAQRELDLASKQTALPVRRYGVIVADPEWRFEPYSRETGMDRAADNHYPTSVTDIIAERDVLSIAADDCVLFLWATVPMLRDALRVMEAWGFEYKSHAVWDKIHIGTGYWFRNRHELLLVGTKGDIPAPAMGDQFASVMTIARKQHSAKPEQFLELIEQYFPNLPKIELNRRGELRPGWHAWGNEVAEAAE